MRKIVLWVTGLFLSVSGFSQVTADIGIWGGGSGYLGDIEDNTLTQSSFPFLGAFYRHNFNPRVSARAMFLMGDVSAQGIIRNSAWEFDKNVQELTLQVEVNFLKFMPRIRKYHFTPYLTAGIGAIHYRHVMDSLRLVTVNPLHNKGESYDEPVFRPTFPFGIGFKFNTGKFLGFGIEYQMRKLFDDRLDDLDDPLATLNSQGKEINYTDTYHNNDWTGYLGLQMTFNFNIGSEPCPAYDKKR